MVGLGPFYHGTNSKFDFKKDFDFAKGVGAIYMFANRNIEGGAAYARYVGKDFGQDNAYLYEVFLKPSTKIVDLTQWNEETQELAALLDSDEELGRLAGGGIGEHRYQNKERWKAFAHCTDEFDMPCVFDVLDYNEGLFEALRALGVDGLYFVDGLDEIKKDIPDSNVPAVALFSTDVIDRVEVYEVETYGDSIKKISEASNLHRLVESVLAEVFDEFVLEQDFFTKEQQEIKFKIHEQSPKENDQLGRGWVVHLIEAFVDGEVVGSIKISYIPEERFFNEYPSILHYIDKIDGSILPNVDPSLPGPDNFKKLSLKNQILVLDSLSSGGYRYYGSRESEKLDTMSDDELKDLRKNFLKAITSKYRDRFKDFKEFHVDKPLVDYIHVEEDYQRKRIGAALYEKAARWLGETKGLKLYASGIQSTQAKGAWKWLQQNKGANIGSEQYENRDRIFLTFVGN